MKFQINIFLLFILMVLNSNLNSQDLTDLGYDLTQTSEKVKLPPNLTEISGLSILDDRIFMIQDEKGKIYSMPILDISQIEETSFGKKGDYEGIEVVDGQVYVIKSNGDIFQSDMNNIDEDSTIEFESTLKAKHNIEGLGYDSDTKTFLIASKEEEPEGNRCIYSLPIENLTGDLVCSYEVDESQLKSKLAENMGNLAFQMSLALTKEDYAFRPSAIAKHPITDDIYILSSPMHQILVLSKKWKIKCLTFLPSKTFRQPEGIAFDAIGNMYISNEGRNKSGNILRFDYNQQK